jgi:hypothetical protein
LGISYKIKYILDFDPKMMRDQVKIGRKYWGAQALREKYSGCFQKGRFLHEMAKQGDLN